MRTAMLWIVGLLQLAIGVTMLFGPQSFYDLVPGVNETGPFNPHFVRDVGSAFLAACSGSPAMYGRAPPPWPGPPSSRCTPSCMSGTGWSAAVAAIRVRPARISGLPGFVTVEPDGTVQTLALEIAGAEIAAIYIVRNPDKLRHVST
jgi:hypothetical protein